MERVKLLVPGAASGIIAPEADGLSLEEEVLETKMTEMLGVKYPIQCGTMHGLTTAEVTAPLAEAGCFCCLPAWPPVFSVRCLNPAARR